MLQMSRGLRILQVTDFYDPFLGGMEQHVKMLSGGLAKRGHDVTVATVSLPGTADDEIVDGVRIRRVTGWSDRVLMGWYERAEAPFRPPVPDPGMTAALKRIIREFRPDIVHVQGWIAYSCFAIEPHREFKLVVTLHDYGFACARKTLLQDGQVVCSGPRFDVCLRCAPRQYGIVKGAALTVGLRTTRWLHNRVDSWIAVSQFVADSIRCVLPRGCEIRVIPPASPEPPSSGQRPQWLPAEDYLLFVGALGSHKGLNWLLDAYAGGGVRRPLVVIGTSRRDTPRTWPADVVVKTDVPHREVMEAWSNAEIGLVPSLWPEPFGLIAVEAMRSGVPVVASRIGALSGVVADGITGLLVTPGNTVELRAAIQLLDADTELRRAMGSAALLRAEQFSANIVINLYEQHYRWLLARASEEQLNAAGRSKEFS
jgi:glycosyltransferase involved in cell wall biosynthesis